MVHERALNFDSDETAGAFLISWKGLSRLDMKLEGHAVVPRTATIRYQRKAVDARREESGSSWFVFAGGTCPQ